MSKAKENWRDNPQWKSGRIESSKSGAAFFWGFTIIWNAISSPVLIKGIPEMLEKEAYWKVAVMALFPFIGALLLLFCFYKTLQAIKYPKSILNLETNPGVIGGSFKAELLLPGKIATAEIINVRLVNINQVTTGSGKNRSTKRNMIWQSSRNYHPDEWKVSNGKVKIPVDFTISYETRDYDKDNLSNCVYWTLEVYAEMPGIDFDTSFDVPIFKTEESNPEILNSPEDEQRILERPPHIKGITCQEINDGIRIFVHPFRFLGTSITMMLFSLGLLVALFFLIYKSILIPAFFVGLFFALFFSFSIHYLLIQTEIVFSGEHGQIKSTWLGLGVIREFNLKDIKDVRVTTGAQTQSDFSRDTCNYTLEIVPNEGKSLKLSDMTRSYDQALWMAARLKKKADEIVNQS